MIVLVLLLVLALPATASAARNQEATFQDDNELIYTTDKKREKALDTLDALGVDRIRATISWAAVAPNPKSRKRPAFEATDPNAYGDGKWRNYDELVRGAYERGIRINFNLTAPVPLWATEAPPRPDIADNYEPDPVEWLQFVAAVGQRYSGGWERGDGTALPRVDYWSIWNEPNHSGWLTPTWQKSSAGFFPRVAALYRELLDSAYAGLAISGHAKDTILIGETAPSGVDDRDVKRFMKPLVFVRALYCLDDRMRRLSGARAKRLGCPETGREMVTEHPALFKASGFAHHPYQLLTAPDVTVKDRDVVTMASLERLTRTLDTALRRYGQRRRLPVHLTEYGYQTPPDRVGVTFAKQAEFLNQSEYMAWRNRRVRTMAQFLLVDDKEPIGLTFQSGLISRRGRREKPAFDAYRLPIWVSGKRVWGVLRPAEPGARATAKLQARRTGGSWRTVRTVRARGRQNTVLTRVPAGADQVRLSYDGNHSRTTTVKGA